MHRPVRVRFAPSPTGRTHLGSARTALYNYLLARQAGGTFLLRIEDTDRKRYVPASEDELKESLRWLGIEWEEGVDVGGPHAPYHQSERKLIYQDHARQLVEAGNAYYCFCSPQRLAQMREEQIKRKQPAHYDGTCRRIDPSEAKVRVQAGERHVIRFKVPETGSITIRDHLRGEIVVENRNIDDYIIVKSDGLALYHLAAMVDDHLMEISHVIRGAEWLSTLPLHAHIIRAFGWEEPVWVHLSVFLKPSGKGKMSKRDIADVMKDSFSIYILDLREMGYLPEAVVNWIALMGWSLDDHTEFFTMPDLMLHFSLDHLNPAPAAINFTKLDHFNGVHIRRLTLDELVERIKPFFQEAGYEVDEAQLKKIAPIIQERIVTLEDAPQVAGIFFQEEIHLDPQDLTDGKIQREDALRVLRSTHRILETLPTIEPQFVEQPVRALVDELGMHIRDVFGVLRMAITGQKVSPPLFESMEIFGRQKVFQRLEDAIQILEDVENGE
jgi:glutamyl-tRNA synthetase